MQPVYLGQPPWQVAGCSNNKIPRRVALGGRCLGPALKDIWLPAPTWQTTAWLQYKVQPAITNNPPPPRPVQCGGGESELHSTQHIQNATQSSHKYYTIELIWQRLICVDTILWLRCLGVSHHVISLTALFTPVCFVRYQRVSSHPPSLCNSRRRHFLSLSPPLLAQLALLAGAGAFCRRYFYQSLDQPGQRLEMGQSGHWVWLIPPIVSH